MVDLGTKWARLASNWTNMWLFKISWKLILKNPTFLPFIHVCPAAWCCVLCSSSSVIQRRLATEHELYSLIITVILLKMSRQKSQWDSARERTRGLFISLHSIRVCDQWIWYYIHTEVIFKYINIEVSTKSRTTFWISTWPSRKLPFECQKITKTLTFKKKIAKKLP